MMVWNVTKHGITERMAVFPDEAWSVPGNAQQGPPEKGRPNPMSDQINNGRWRPGFEAQDDMLDALMKENKLEKMDWRPKMYRQMEAKQ